METIKTLVVAIAVLVVCLQAGSSEARSFSRSNTSIAQEFIFKASLKAGGNGIGCANATEFVTPTICKSLAAIDDQFELLSCRVFTNKAGYNVCLGVVEGARDYCNKLGPSLRRGYYAEYLMCGAIQKHLNAPKK